MQLQGEEKLEVEYLLLQLSQQHILQVRLDIAGRGLDRPEPEWQVTIYGI